MDTGGSQGSKTSFNYGKTELESLLCPWYPWLPWANGFTWFPPQHNTSPLFQGIAAGIKGSLVKALWQVQERRERGIRKERAKDQCWLPDMLCFYELIIYLAHRSSQTFALTLPQLHNRLSPTGLTHRDVSQRAHLSPLLAVTSFSGNGYSMDQGNPEPNGQKKGNSPLPLIS